MRCSDVDIAPERVPDKLFLDLRKFYLDTGGIISVLCLSRKFQGRYGCRVGRPN
jgi:hypothetical protein